METSSASGENVEKAVRCLLDMVMKRMREYVTGIDQDGRYDNTKLGAGQVKSEDSWCAC